MLMCEVIESYKHNPIEDYYSEGNFSSFSSSHVLHARMNVANAVSENLMLAM